MSFKYSKNKAFEIVSSVVHELLMIVNNSYRFCYFAV